MSNSFSKVSPDGKWIVYVQCRNGQLMRPDGQLYIVPAEGGTARRMRANTPLMNSWHSFSPNGRWLVFSSKSRSPYTQMFLTHVDEEGNDSPAILIENSTAANRAVNIPEFVNIPPDGLLNIDAQAAEYYRLIDLASDAVDGGEYESALPLLKQALGESPDDAVAHNKYGWALGATSQLGEAIAQFPYAGTTSAIAFAVSNLEVEHIIVMGQARCGGIRALMENKQPECDEQQLIARWLSIAADVRQRVLADMPDKSHEVQARACEQAAILKSLENLMSYPWVRKRVSEGKLALHGWYFDMKIGALMQYHSSAGEFRVIDLNLDHPGVPLQASQMFENWESSPP